MPHENNRKGHYIRKTYLMLNKLTGEVPSNCKGNSRACMPQEVRIVKDDSMQRLPGKFLSDNKD